MTHEDLKWLILSMAGCTVSVVGAVTWLATLVFRIGQKYGSVEATLSSIQDASKRVESSAARLDRIPILETKLDQLADSITEERRRFASAWPTMVEKVTTLWERSRRDSQGQFGE